MEIPELWLKNAKYYCLALILVIFSMMTRLRVRPAVSNGLSCYAYAFRIVSSLFVRNPQHVYSFHQTV